MNKEHELAEQQSNNTEEVKSSILNDSTSSDQQEEQENISNYSKEELLQLIQNYKLSESVSQANTFLKEVKSQFEHLIEIEREQALQKFIEDGGSEGDFDFRKDKTTQDFEKAYETLKSKVSQTINNLEKEKEKNLQIKNDLLDKLRQLTSSEETNMSINTLKEIQDQWRSTGPVPANQAQTLWANFNGLLEIFYNNRSIYFELKELDRKKNLELKREICDKAARLADSSDVLNAVKELRILHDEFKHIGPVPKEDQDELWNKFKAASDKVYEKRKEYYASAKIEVEDNYKKKLEILEKLEPYTQLKTDKIDEWKNKTKDVLAIQEEWKKIGRVPNDKIKETSKKFWSYCKGFFNNKNAFFKELESKKEENLKKKVDLCEQAEAIKDSEDVKSTANTLKNLQKQWEAVGPVPIKSKDTIYKRFKAACDAFFGRQREQNAEAEKEFEANLKKKSLILDQIETLAEKGNNDSDKLKALQNEWKSIGFVPKAETTNVNNRYNKVIEKYIASLELLNKEEKDDLKMAMQIAVLKGNPAADKKIYHKENEIQRNISTLRKEIDRYNTNIDFLARSPKADKLREEINSKIQLAQNELKTLESQLKLLKEA